jgi:hypothetical protein
MKKFFVLVALLGISVASFGCGGEGAKKVEPTAPPAGGAAEPAAEPAKAP